MKLDVPLCIFEIETVNSQAWQRSLWRELWQQYGQQYLQSDGQAQAYVPLIELSLLPHMAIWLRREGWKVYYWKDHPVILKPRYPIWYQNKTGQMIYANQAGLVFGPYCSNLTYWCLGNL